MQDKLRGHAHTMKFLKLFPVSPYLVYQSTTKQSIMKKSALLTTMAFLVAVAFGPLKANAADDNLKPPAVKKETARPADKPVLKTAPVPAARPADKTIAKTAPATAARPAAPTSGPLKKDGTPDMRYKTNKKTSTPAAGPLKKDGTPDKRYKANRK